MQVSARHWLGGATLVLSTAVATASPIPLDTEQKAAAGIATALFTTQVPSSVNSVIDDVRDYADFTLKTVEAATTPAALIGTPGGITVNCSVSGTFEARMPNVQPRVLRVKWNDCVTRVRHVDRTLNGPVAITLPADTFRPQNVLAIRFGNANGEFLQQWRNESAEQNDDNTDAFDITLLGDISMTRRNECCDWIGSSSFEMKGYYDNRRSIENPVGSPPAFYGYKVSAQRLTVIRSTNADDEGRDDDARYVGGSVSFTETQPYYGVWTRSYKFNDYSLARLTDYVTFTEQLSVNGRMNVTWSPFAGAGCIDGLYAFRTREPLVGALFSEQFESGKLVVNGDAVASFYSAANTPPALPTPVNGMLLSMRVKDIGRFNYDVPSWIDAVFPAGQCRP